MRTRIRWALKPRRGQALVEAALILPVILVLTFGVADMGLYMYQYIQASNCAREAARRAAVRDYANAVKPPYCDERKIAVALYDANNVKITSSSGLPGTGSAVTARSEATYNWFVLDHLVPKFPVTSPIRAKVMMRMEASQV